MHNVGGYIHAEAQQKTYQVVDQIDLRKGFHQLHPLCLSCCEGLEFEDFEEANSMIWNLDLCSSFYGKLISQYGIFSFSMAITRSATFTQILWNLADNFYTRILGFLKLELILIGVDQIQWHTTFTPEIWDF